MTSLLSAPLSVRTQSHNANAPVFLWREDACCCHPRLFGGKLHGEMRLQHKMVKNSKYKVNFYVFVGYVEKRGKKRKREKKKTEKRGRLSKVQREREQQIAS